MERKNKTSVRNIKSAWKLGRFGQFRKLPAVMALALSEQWPLSTPKATSLGIPPKNLNLNLPARLARVSRLSWVSPDAH